MSLSSPKLADELIRIIEINRTIINGLTFGEVIFRSHRAHLVEVTATETLKMATGAQLCPLSLKREESK